MTVSNNPIRWEESWDDEDNSIWEASGPFGDEEGGCLGSWRLVQRFCNNQVKWEEDHDLELRDSRDGGGWLNLNAAKQDIEKTHLEILNSYEP